MTNRTTLQVYIINKKIKNQILQFYKFCLKVVEILKNLGLQTYIGTKQQTSQKNLMFQMN